LLSFIIKGRGNVSTRGINIIWDASPLGV
jgi:hypothetical protein